MCGSFASSRSPGPEIDRASGCARQLFVLGPYKPAAPSQHSLYPKAFMTSTGSLCTTGVPGLDDILGGGLPRNCLYLVDGNPGVGKTTLALPFLLQGVKEKERCLRRFRCPPPETGRSGRSEEPGE